MVELVVIMVIIGILSAFASSRLNFASHDADGYAGIVKSSIRLAQKLAIARRASVTVSFSPCGGSAAGGTQIAGGDCDPLPAGVTVTGPGSITFDGLGRSSGVTTVTAIIVSGGDVSRTICLEPETGYVHERTPC